MEVVKIGKCLIILMANILANHWPFLSFMCFFPVTVFIYLKPFLLKSDFGPEMGLTWSSYWNLKMGTIV